jgi:O-antigen ligase
MERETWRRQFLRGEILGPIAFTGLFFAYYISPRSILSVVNIDNPIPAQIMVLALTFVLIITLFLTRSLLPSVYHIPIRMSVVVLAGSAGIAFTFTRSLEATLWSRPTLDLASMLLLVPLAFLAGSVSQRIVPPMLWVFVSLFVVQLLWAISSGPNERAAYSFYSVHTIEFGLMMGTATLVSLTLFLDSPRWFLLLFPIIFGAGVMISLSRGALIATICGAAIILLLEARKATDYRSVIFVVGLVPLGAWALSSLVYAQDPRIQKLASVTESGTLTQFFRTSDSDRWKLWQLVLDKAPSGWGILWGSGDSYVDRGYTELSHPHNLFLTFGVTGGLIALLLIGVFLFVAFYLSVSATRHDPSSPLLAGLLALWAIHLQFNGGIGDGANLFLLAGFALGRISMMNPRPTHGSSVFSLRLAKGQNRKTSEP